MKRISKDEIEVHKAVEADEQDAVKKLAEELLRKHCEAHHPKHSTTGVHQNWATDTRPRWQGKVVGPITPQHGK